MKYSAWASLLLSLMCLIQAQAAPADPPAEEEEGGEDEDAVEDSEGCVAEDQTTYTGNNIDIGGTGRAKGTEVENVQACALLSLSTEGACYWSYDPKAKLCWVKNSKDGKKFHKFVMSGNNDCGGAPGCVVDEDTEYDGEEIKKEEDVENIMACAKLSAETKGARYWTYTADKVCSVKKTNEGKTKTEGVISGNRMCGA